MLWGSLKKVSEGEQVENFTFFEFLTCFLTCFDGFFAISKKSGTECKKKNLKPKSNYSHAKVDMKAKKYTHFA